MRDKRIKELLDRELENTFHMNARADEAKKNLVFTKRNPKIFMFNKAKFLTLSTVIVLSFIGLSSVITYAINQHINEEKLIKIESQSKYYFIEEANEYLDSLHINYSKLPIVTKNINSKYYLSIYDGYNAKNGQKKSLYFYQFGCYTDDIFDIKLDFYVETNNYQTEILNQKNIAPLTINDNNELSSLYVDVYENNEFLTKLTLI